MNTANFDSKTLLNVFGRSLFATWKPNLGFGDSLLGTLHQANPATVPLQSFAFAGDNIARWTGTLSLSGDDLTTTTIHSAMIRSIYSVITRKRRERVVSYSIDSTVSTAANFQSPSFGFSPQAPLVNGALGDDYQFRLDGTAMENLLGFGSAISDNQAVTLVFAILRTGEQNSFLKKMFDTHDAWNKSRKAFPEFTITFSKVPNLVVSPKTLDHISVLELAGSCLAQPLPPLAAKMLDDQAGSRHDTGLTALDLLAHHRDQNFEQPPHGETVEIATVCFKPGHYRTIDVV